MTPSNRPCQPSRISVLTAGSLRKTVFRECLSAKICCKRMFVEMIGSVILDTVYSDGSRYRITIAKTYYQEDGTIAAGG
jgi:hypothetical protein